MGKAKKQENDELVCLIRGACGGFLFAVPIIYTMEVWWLGHTMPTHQALGFLAFGYVLALGLNLFSGFRADTRLREVFGDAIVALALGIVVAVVMLTLVGVINGGTVPRTAIGQIAVLAVPVSIGVSLARSQFGDTDLPDAEPATGWMANLVDIGTTVIGAVFTGMAIAPTEEIIVIVEHGTLGHSLATVALSLLLSYAMVFVAAFSGGSSRETRHGPLQTPLGETFVSYALSLAVAGALLVFLGYFEGQPSAGNMLTMLVVLGLPCTLGGAAGRLLL